MLRKKLSDLCACRFRLLEVFEATNGGGGGNIRAHTHSTPFFEHKSEIRRCIDRFRGKSIQLGGCL